ncbi:MAG: tetratricopeptide repeat protein [Candidatus Riflebacteria bacterium]|nr:tetratricopeptide repeat protein [Candidatus Riflebacteria bacterium]
MRICAKCGFENESGRFCGKCGANLSLSDVSSSARAILQKAQKNFPSPPSVEEPPEDKTKPVASKNIDLQNISGKISSEPFDKRPVQVEKTESDEDNIEKLTSEVKSKPGSLEAYYRLAMAQFRKGKFERAFSSWRALKALAPEDVRVYSLGAKIFEALGRIEDAVHLLGKIFGSGAADIDTTLSLSKLLYESGKKKESLTVLETLRSKASEHPEILLRIAENQLLLGDLASAQEDLSLFRKIAGETREVFLLLGRTMLLRSFFDGAVKLYCDALKKFPDDPDFSLGYGKALLGMGERGNALLEFERAAAKAPDRCEILLEMGMLFGKMNMDDKAEEIFTKIRSQKIRSGEVFLEIARFYHSRAKNAQALIELERARDLSPHNPEIVRTYSEILEASGNQSKAIAEYESFLQTSPGCLWAIQGIIRAARQIDDHARVYGSLKTLIKSGLATPDLWCDAGESLIRLGKLDEASKAFEEASKIDPTCVRAYQAPELIKLEKARAEGEKLVKQARDAASKKFFLTASEMLERALEMLPRETSWMRILAEVCLKTGAVGRAGELLSKIRVAYPNDYWICHNLARVYEFEEKSPLAIELLTSGVRENPLEFDGQMLLLRLKRSRIQGKSVEKEMFAAYVRNLQNELASFRKTSPVPLLLEAYLHYLFGMGSKFEQDFIKKGENLFLEVLSAYPENPHAHKGLSLIYRAQADFKKASFHIQELVKVSADPFMLYYVGRFFSNFQAFADARKFFVSLRNLFPENFLYRRKTIESIASEGDSTGKSELGDLINSLQDKLRTDSDKQLVLHDLAWAQTLMARRSPQKDEWQKRALLTWNKALALSEPSPWIRWSAMETQTESLRGTERLKSIQANLRNCEKIAREHPDMPHAHYYLGLAHLAFEDLTQTDRASGHFETAAFLNPEFVECWQALGQCYRTLGKSARLDGIKLSVILSEPELLVKI